MPRLTIAVLLLMLVALASVMTYTGFLVVGVLADYLGTGRFLAGLLLAGLFARFPWISKGKLRVVGLLPKPVRRPLIAGLLALCLVHFLLQGDTVSAVFTGLTMAIVFTFPWLKRTVVDRMASVFKRTGQQAPQGRDDMVIDGEFRERKD